MASRFGSYELLRRLGAGATAEVYLASGPNPADADLVALKIVLPHLAGDAGLRDSLVKEAKLCERIQHRHVARIFGVGEEEGRPYLAMEYVRGWTVSHVLKKLREVGQTLTLDEACSMVRDAALGLHHAHELLSESGKSLGLIHRDVSPQNLILGHDGRVKVVDFGLAKATQALQDHTGEMKGKIAYMPPEQIQGGKLDRKVDVFALGAVLFELLTGERMYPGKNEAEILQQAVILPPPDLPRLLAGVPAPVVEAIARATARDLQARTSNALVFAHAIKGFIEPETPSRLSQRIELLFDPDAVLATAPAEPSAPRGRPSAPRPAAAARPRPPAEEPRREPEPPPRKRTAPAAASASAPEREPERPARRAPAAEPDRPARDPEALERAARRPSGERARPLPEPAEPAQPSVPRRKDVAAVRPLEPLPQRARAGLRPLSMPLAEPELTSSGEERWSDNTAARVILARPARSGLKRLLMALGAVAFTLLLGALAFLAMTRVRPLDAVKNPGVLRTVDPDEEPVGEHRVPGARIPLGKTKELRATPGTTRAPSKAHPKEIEVAPMDPGVKPEPLPADPPPSSAPKR